MERPVIQSQKVGAFSANSMVQAFACVFDAAGIEDASGGFDGGDVHIDPGCI